MFAGLRRMPAFAADGPAGGSRDSGSTTFRITASNRFVTGRHLNVQCS
jgi:hypothetical protein